MVWTELQLVNERLNKRLADEAHLNYQAQAAIHAPKSASAKAFQKTLKRLQNGG